MSSEGRAFLAGLFAGGVLALLARKELKTDGSWRGNLRLALTIIVFISVTVALTVFKYGWPTT